MSPYTLNNTNDAVLTEWNATFGSIRSAFHIVVIGAETSSFSKTHKNYYNIINIESNYNYVAMGQDDVSRASLCSMCLMKKWFHFASTSQGGFSSAPVYLARSTAFLIKLPSLLIEFPSKSLVSRLEATSVGECRCRISSTKEKNVIKL